MGKRGEEVVVLPKPDPTPLTPSNDRPQFEFFSSKDSGIIIQRYINRSGKMAASPPRVFISYSHDSIKHKDLVLRFADRLSKECIEPQIDHYVGGGPPGGGPRWML